MSKFPKIFWLLLASSRENDCNRIDALLNKDYEKYDQYVMDSIEINNKLIEILNNKRGIKDPLEVYAMELFT